jgi:hypothetical protein
MKQENPNTNLYYTLLKAANERGKSLRFNKNTANQNLNRGLDNKYNIINKELNKSSVTKIERPNTTTIFYPRLINENNIYVSNDVFLPSAKFQNIFYGINNKAG